MQGRWLERPWLAWLMSLAGASLAACGGSASDVASPDGGETSPPKVGQGDAGPERSTPDAGVADGCDLSGAWVTQHVTTNTALGAPQLATNWSYHVFEQDGTRVRIVDSLDCGYVVRGTTDVALADATLEAMAVKATHAVGVEGTLVPTDGGQGCELELDRIYTIRGANRAMFLDSVWEVGDPPRPLSAFTLPSDASDGMEDWDHDGHEGITQLTGLGDRYTAQIDWYALSGTLPLVDGKLGVDPIGTEPGVIVADYDARESVSMETPALLRTSSVPAPPGYGSMVRADRLARLREGESPELETCRSVQALAVQSFGDPPKP